MPAEYYLDTEYARSFVETVHGIADRHAFDPDADLVRQFQSGYTNVSCETQLGAHEHSHDDEHTHSHGRKHVH